MFCIVSALGRVLGKNAMLLTYASVVVVVLAAFGSANNKIYAGSQHDSMAAQPWRKLCRMRRERSENELCDFFEICGVFFLSTAKVLNKLAGCLLRVCVCICMSEASVESTAA